MKAVIELSGRQFLVSEGTRLQCDRLPEKENENIQVDKVLMAIDGEKNLIGKPYLKEVSVTAKIVRHYKDKKILIFKYKSKNDYRRKRGHRQPRTEILIEKING